jgi:hypothetical protein
MGSLFPLTSSNFLVGILVKFGNYQQIFVKVATIKYHENPSNGSNNDACGQSDRHDEDKNHFLLFIQTPLNTSNPTQGSHFMHTFRTPKRLEVPS